MRNADVLTIPRSMTGDEELVVLPKKKFEELLDRKDEVSAEDVLKWSGEAKTLKKMGKLPILRSFKPLY